jgi:hypothetical protein
MRSIICLGFKPNHSMNYILFILPVLCLTLLLYIFHQYFVLNFHWSMLPDMDCKNCRQLNRRVLFYDREGHLAINESSEESWNSILPPNGGKLIRYDEQTKGPVVFGISMFHQLHCLQMIREQVELSIEMNFSGGTGATQENVHAGSLRNKHTEGKMNHDHREDDYRHVRHCLEYIRQVSSISRFKVLFR